MNSEENNAIKGAGEIICPACKATITIMSKVLFPVVTEVLTEEQKKELREQAKNVVLQSNASEEEKKALVENLDQALIDSEELENIKQVFNYDPTQKSTT